MDELRLLAARILQKSTAGRAFVDAKGFVVRPKDPARRVIGVSHPRIGCGILDVAKDPGFVLALHAIDGILDWGVCVIRRVQLIGHL